MAYELPGRGDPLWDSKLNASIAAVKVIADNALPADDVVTSAFASQVKGLVLKLVADQPVKGLIMSASICSGYNVNGSTVEGVYQADVDGTGRKIIAALATKYGNTHMTVVNAGVAGVGSRSVLGGGQANGHMAGIGVWLDKERPDFVLLNINSNDATTDLTPVDEYESNWLQIIREIRRFGAVPVVIPPFEHYVPSTQAALYEQHKVVAARALALEGVQPLAVHHTLETTAGSHAALSGTTADGVHPNATGAALIATAAAAYFPDVATLADIPNVIAGRQPVGTYADPVHRGGHAEWVTADGDTRRSRVQPSADNYTARATSNELDGWSVASPPGLASALRLRGSVGCYDFVQGTSAAVLYDKSGSGNNGAVSGTPTWNVGGGMVFDGVDDAIRIPLDSLGRLKATPGREWFTVRVVFKPSTAGATQNIVTRRGDGTASPFGLFLSTGVLSVFERNNTVATGSTPSTSAYEDWIISWSLFDQRVHYYKNGGQVSNVQSISSTAAVSGDAWDWLIGTRFVGTNPATATATGARFTGTIQWVDIARSYVSPSGTEVADLYASLKAVLNTRSGVTLP